MKNNSAKNSGSASPANKSALLWIAAIATLVAVAFHAYLLHEHLELRFGEITGASLCNLSATWNCAAVSASQYSEILGFPVALLGVFANVVLLVFIAWYALADDDKAGTARASILTLGTIIAIASIVMGGISSLILHRYCPFCFGAYILSFIMVACIWMAMGRSGEKIQGGFAVPIVICLIALLGVKITSDELVSSYNSGNLADLAKAKAQEWKTAAPVAINTLEPLVEGASAEASKFTIVEFADFRCSHCKHAAPVLHAFVRSHPDARLEFLAWPLDGECNTAITGANGASCLLARTVYCAQKTGGNGWAAHSYVYENQEKYMTVDSVRGALPAIAEAAGVPSDRLIACADSAETKSTIEKQAAIGTALKLEGTPTVYVNGKKLEGGQSMSILTEAYKAL